MATTTTILPSPTYGTAHMHTATTGSNTTTLTPAPQPTMVYTKETKLNFTTYKPSVDYSHWKALCLLEAANNNSFSNITTKEGMKHVLNTHMTTHESSTLYLSTTKALGTHAFNIISITDTETANVVDLWKAMDEHFNEKEDSFLLKYDIKCQFQALNHNPSESIDNYQIRFEKKLHIMTINNIVILSTLELVFQFLNQMYIKRVFDNII